MSEEIEAKVVAITKKAYWGEAEEEAIKKYLSTESEKERNFLFKTIIDPAVKKLIDGVYLYVEKKYGKVQNLNPKELKDDSYLDLLSKLGKYTNYEKRSFSFYQTCVKNYILGEKIRSDNVNRNKIDYTDINQLADKESLSYKIVEQTFDEFRKKIMFEISETLKGKSLTEKEKKVGFHLIYMLDNWHKINFDTKNQFMRQLKNYSGCKDILVTKAFKKFKKIYENIKRNE